VKVEQQLRLLRRQVRAVRALTIDDPVTETYLALLAAREEVAALHRQLRADVAEARASRDRRRADNLRALAAS